MDTQQAWKDGRPTLSRLPGINDGYSGNEVADWLTDYPDQLLHGLRVMSEVATDQVNPLTCEPQWLDLLSNLCGWYGYWDLAWPEASKRQLLAASYTEIWPKYGTATALSFVLQTLGVTHVIQQGQSFLIGVNEVGDPLGAIAWQYDIVLPTAFFNTKESALAERINSLFGPVWCTSRILFDDEFFQPTGFFELEENTLLQINDTQTVLEL